MVDDVRSWWDVHQRRVVEPISDERLENPFADLPGGRTLTRTEKEWLATDFSHSTTLLQMVQYERASAIAGPSPEEHRRRRHRLTELQAKTRRLGLRLPTNFLTFMLEDDYVDRLRFRSHRIELSESLLPSPICESFFMLRFLRDIHGADDTHLLLVPDGRHCVIRTTNHDEELPPDFFHYADSFAEFICRASDEVRQFEQAEAERQTSLADEQLSSADIDGAYGLYELALSYDPDSPEIAQRIRICETALARKEIAEILVP